VCTGQPTYFALSYYVVDDYIARRAAFRNDHLGLVRKAYDRGDLVLAGAFSDLVDDALPGALLIFRGKNRKVAEDFARIDPYVINELVTRWEIREWSVVPLG